MMRILAVMVTSLGLAGAAMAQDACLSDSKDDQAIEGRLAILDAQDAAGRPQKPYVLLLSQPVCLTAEEPDDSVDSSKSIHIFSSDDAVHQQIAGFVGKAVQVRGRPFPAHTAHHHAPVVMDITAITAR